LSNDGENRLHSMTKSGTTITFLYDWMGRRVAKTVNGTTTTYLYGHDPRHLRFKPGHSVALL